MTRHTDGLSFLPSRTNQKRMSLLRRGGRRWWVCAVVIVLGWPAIGRPEPAASQPSSNRPQEAIEASAGESSAAPIVLAGKSGKLRATIRTDEVAADRVTLPVGTSAVLDVNLPVARVEVARPEIANVTVLSPRQVLVGGYAMGTTQVILWEEGGDRLVIAVQVEPNLAQLKDAIKTLAPDADVQVRVINDVIILSGSVRDVDVADRIESTARIVSPNVQNQMTVMGGQQVLLRCTVAEVSKSAVRQLGVDAWASFEENAPRITAHELSGIDTSLIGPTGAAGASGGTALFGNRFLFGGSPHGFQLTQSSRSLQMELFVRAMQENGLLRILAEPNVVALSGQKAEFLVGGEFPVPVPQEESITIEWKDYGIILQFLPTVIGQQMIRLKVAPEVSEIDYTNAVQIAGYTVPGVTQRRAETTIEMASGSTLAIAGLLSENVRGLATKVPGLGDLPILGALFRSVEYRCDLTELVILVTPELVSGMYPDQVPAAPGQAMSHPSDWELYGLGLLEGEPVPEEPSRAAALHTRIGPHYRKFASPPEQMSLHGPWGPAEASETVQ